MVIEVKIDDPVFVLINIYNANTEPGQLHTLNDLLNIFETFHENIQDKHFVLGGDFNAILNRVLDSEGGKPAIKKKTIAKPIQTTENLDFCDIWRIHKREKPKEFILKENDLLLDNTIPLILFKDV